MADARLEQLAGGRLGPLLLRYSWPALVSMALNSLYTVVDRVFIGKFGSVADPSLCSHVLAGLSLSFPLLMAVAAFGVMIGVGSASMISIRLGEGRRGEAEKLLGQCVALKLAMAAFAPLLFFFARDIYAVLGGAKVSPAALDAAACYTRTLAFSLVFSHLAFGMSACMRAEGAPAESMKCMIVGFGANFVLDPLFIWAFQAVGPVRDFFGAANAGLAGAAWATNVAMFLSCAKAMSYYARGRSSVRLRASAVRIWRGSFGRVLAIGLSPFLQQIVGAAAALSLNASLAIWAADELDATRQVAVAGMFSTVVIVFLMPIMGMQQGLAPILGYGWGARRFDRVRDALAIGLKLTGAVCFAVFAAVMVFARPICWCLADAGTDGLIDTAARVIRLSNCLVFCIFVNITATTYYQSIGRPAYAIGLSFMRQGLCLIPCIWLLPLAFQGDPVAAIWAATPASDLLACIATIPFLAREWRFLGRVAGKAKARWMRAAAAAPPAA